MSAEASQRNILLWLWWAVLFFSFSGAILFPLVSNPHNFWTHWEVTSVIITAIYTGLVYAAFFFVHPRLHRFLTGKAQGWSLLFFVIGLSSLATAILFAVDVLWITKVSPVSSIAGVLQNSCAHVALLLVASISMCFANHIIANGWSDEPRETNCERIKAAKQHLEEVRSAVRYCDTPTVFAFAIIFIFVLIVVNKDTANDVELRAFSHHLKAFIGGAVSFQLLLSNIIYGLQFVEWGKGPGGNG